MSWIDDLGVKAANAGSGQVNLTGNELRTLLNAIASAGSGGGGSGLAVTGLDNGATVQDQIFENGVTVGKLATNGILNFKNSADTSLIVASSTAAKTLGIDNTGHDVKVGINTATPSVALEVAGGASFGQIVDNGGNIVIFQQTTGQTIDISTVADCDIYLTTSGTGAIALTAASGVTTSAGLTVGGGFKATSVVTKSVSYLMTSDDFTVLLDTNSGAVNISMPAAAAGNKGQIYVAVYAVGGDVGTVSGLEGGTYTFATVNDAIQFQSDGAAWRIISEYKQ